MHDIVGEGLDACVWSAGPGCVAKIYRPERLPAVRRDVMRQKVATLIGMRAGAINHPALGHVIWPESLLVDDAGHFIGFSMRSAAGAPLHLVIKDQSWTLSQRLEVARQLSRIVAALHCRRVYVGDLSPNNVLVRGDAGGIEVSLIDVDSVSLPGFPCNTVTSRYMLPAVHRGEETFVAGPTGDAYALAFLLFELVLGGISPYAHKGGEDSEEANIKKQFFALAEDPNRVPTLPLPWLSRWRTLPVPAQQMFEAAFRRGSQARPSAGAWAALLSSISFPSHWADVAQRVPAAARGLAQSISQGRRKTA